MAVKSIIDIDVNDEQFKRFNELFNKYKTALDKMPSSWKKVGKESGNTADTFQAMTAALLAQNQLHKDINTSSNQSNQTLHRQTSLWNTIHRSTTGVLRNVTGIAKMLTEMGIGLGLGAIGFGVGSLFGLLSLGKSVSNQRNAALGLGMSIGQHQAFNLYQGRSLPGQGNAVLTGALQAPYAGSAAGQLTSFLGISPLGSTYSVANRELLGVQRYFRGMNKNEIAQQLAAIPFFSGAGFDLSTVTTLEHLNPGELQRLITEGTAAIPGLNMSNRGAAGWQNFVSRIETDFGTMAKSIENAFMGSGLLRPIERLMRTATADFGMLLRSPLAKKALSDLAEALNKFANYIASGGFTQAIKDFGQDVKQFATATQHFGFGVAATTGVFTHPLKSTSTAFSYYMNSLAEFEKSHPSAIWDALGINVTSSPTTATTPNTHVHAHVHVKVTKPAGSDIHAAVSSAVGVAPGY